MLFPMLNVLHFYISTFTSICEVVKYNCFFYSLTSCFPGTMPGYFLNDSQIVPVAPIFMGVTFHMRCVPSFFITFLSHDIATSINTHVGYAVAQFVEEIRYKQECRGFDYRWSHRNPSFT
jgi:hypothetical protein